MDRRRRRRPVPRGGRCARRLPAPPRRPRHLPPVAEWPHERVLARAHARLPALLRRRARALPALARRDLRCESSEARVGTVRPGGAALGLLPALLPAERRQIEDAVG